MSTLQVKITEILGVIRHPNADRLAIYRIFGWNIIAELNKFVMGDKVIYIPIDSILSQTTEAKIFPPDSKITLSHRRVKAIKIRGIVSQGIIVDPHLFGMEALSLNKDVADELGITKYEPPEPVTHQGGLPRTSRKQSNPNFHRFTDIENFKWYPHLFAPGETVFITEKIHGTNFRCGWVPTYANTWWKKIKQYIGILPKFEFIYGSHNVQFQDTPRKKGWYGASLGKNVYAEAVEKYDLRNKLAFGEVIYAEIYGDGIQKNYLYGCKPGQRKMVVIDWQHNGKYLDHSNTITSCADRNLPIVPFDGSMPYDESILRLLVDSPSWLGDEVREGIVIKPAIETSTFIGRKILKFKSDKFLLTQVDDTH